MTDDERKILDGFEDIDEPYLDTCLHFYGYGDHHTGNKWTYDFRLLSLCRYMSIGNFRKLMSIIFMRPGVSDMFPEEYNPELQKLHDYLASFTSHSDKLKSDITKRLQEEYAEFSIEKIHLDMAKGMLKQVKGKDKNRLSDHIASLRSEIETQREQCSALKRSLSGFDPRIKKYKTMLEIVDTYKNDKG